MKQLEGGQLEIDCNACGATLTVEAHIKTAQCPYCDSPSIVPRPPTPDRPVPTFVLGFIIEQKKATNLVKEWIKARRFARSDFQQASVGKTRGVYLPAYLYGAVAKTNYTAQIGENYQETETYTTTDSNGNTVTRTRTVTRTEWRDLAGEYETYVVDVIVTASKGIPNDELEAIEPFDMRTLKRFHPAMISGWIAEEPSLSRDECMKMAKDESLGVISNELSRFMPGDSYTDLQHWTALHDEVADLVMLPIWVFAVRYAEDREPVRILLNGQTGKAYGKVPLSWVKITLAIVGGLAVLGLIALIVYLLTGTGGGGGGY